MDLHAATLVAVTAIPLCKPKFISVDSIRNGPEPVKRIYRSKNHLGSYWTRSFTCS